jgi:uncharacterized protein with HEPN domain
MSRREWRLFVADMLEASGKISGYDGGMSFEDFCADTRTVDAVVRNLEIIGEASRGIPDDKKLLKPEIDWAAIRGLRNRIVHEYFGLSLSVIWTIVQTDLPVLAQQLSSWSNESR